MPNNDAGWVYYIGGRLLALQQLQKQSGEIDDKIQKTQDDLQRVKSAQHALEEVQSLLEQMRAYAVLGTAEDCPNREELQKEMDALKVKIDQVFNELDI